ncbi:multidrug transporter CflA, partial [Aquitalea magnusonii]
GWLYLPLTAGIIVANLLAKRLLDHWHYDDIVTAGTVCFVIGGLIFILIARLHMTGTAFIVLPMCLVSLANGSSLSLAVSGAIGSDHGYSATASGMVGFFQIGSAALAAMSVSAMFGTSEKVLGISVFVLSLIAALACRSQRKHTSRSGISLKTSQ